MVEATRVYSITAKLTAAAETRYPPRAFYTPLLYITQGRERKGARKEQER